MGESGWLTRNCIPLEVQRTHDDCVLEIFFFQDKTRVQSKHLCLLVFVLLCYCIAVADIGWSFGW